jgi:hypothetical protein
MWIDSSKRICDALGDRGRAVNISRENVQRIKRNALVADSEFSYV